MAAHSSASESWTFILTKVQKPPKQTLKYYQHQPPTVLEILNPLKPVLKTKFPRYKRMRLVKRIHQKNWLLLELISIIEAVAYMCFLYRWVIVIGGGWGLLPCKYVNVQAAAFFSHVIEQYFIKRIHSSSIFCQCYNFFVNICRFCCFNINKHVYII